MFCCGASTVENLNMSMPAGKRVARLKKKKQLSWEDYFGIRLFFSHFLLLYYREKLMVKGISQAVPVCTYTLILFLKLYLKL